MLDHFYERELLPRFEQARSLKEASVARKIGALREAVTSAIEVAWIARSALRLQTRRSTCRDLEVDTPRLLTGEVGEQGTALDRTFRELGETPAAVLDLVAEQAVLWARSRICKPHPFFATCRMGPRRCLEACPTPYRTAAERRNRAIESLQRIAREMSKDGCPGKGGLRHSAARYATIRTGCAPSDAINVSHWKFLGEAVVRSGIKTSLRESVGPLLKDELYHYGMALAQWGEQLCASWRRW